MPSIGISDARSPPWEAQMKDRDPYHLAFSTLARFVSEGRFGWGAPLVTTTLAQELRLSATPVREALARLAGEGMIEHRRGRGYFAPSPAPVDIVELYGLHSRLVSWALEDRGPMGTRFASVPVPSDGLRIERIFTALAGTTANTVLSNALRRVSAQLRPVRVIEAVAAPVSGQLIARLEELAVGTDLGALKLAVDGYHDDRSRRADAVFIAMKRTVQNIDQI